MTIEELYARIPREHHNRIQVIGQRVIVNLPRRTVCLANTDNGLVLESSTEKTTDLLTELGELGL